MSEVSVNIKVMNATPNRPPSLPEQVWETIDPTGEHRVLIAAADLVPDLPNWVSAFDVDLAREWGQIKSLAVKFDDLVAVTKEALECLTPRGWAIAHLSQEAIREAVRLVRAGRGDEADELLAAQWEGDRAVYLKRACDQMRSMCLGDPELDPLFKARARLMWKAKEHHEAGRYNASIPILQAQIEGLAVDVTKRKFFTKRNPADVVDPARLVTIEANLTVLHQIYGADVPVTQVAGSLSRHGVAHGRELAYDTRINSAKTWSLMDAMVEWAQPLMQTEVARRRAERHTANVGSQETDASGRRLDDREFVETAKMLQTLKGSALGWHGQLGRFRDDLAGGMYGDDDFQKVGLHGASGTFQQVRHDGQEVTYWRTTVSGWVIGIALTRVERGFMDRFYDGPTAPAGGPSEVPEVWYDMPTINWRFVR